MRSFLSMALVLLHLANQCPGAVIQNAQSLPTSVYDFVVIGGGTAGGVIANRLSENPAFSVLVIEAGPSNEGIIDSVVPYFASNLMGSPYDWNFTTTPQAGLGGRTVAYPRGRVLGGSSSINIMAYTRGSSSDYDRFAKVTGDNGWSWKKLQPYIRKNERWTAPADNHNTTGQFDPNVHGFDGINFVSLNGFPTPPDSRVLQTTKDLPEEFPFNLDLNSGNPLGVGYVQSTIGNGKRSSSATSYLGPKFSGRPNLHILLHTTVTRVLPQGGHSPIPHIGRVEMSSGTKGQKRIVTARKEVILSAGSIGTPHILMHSGIGDASEVASFNIKPLVHLPSVGKNLSEQPLLSMGWASTSTDPLDTVGHNATLFNEFYSEWNKSHTGLFVDASPSALLTYTRLPPNSPIFKDFSDPSSGPNSPHMEIVIGNPRFPELPAHIVGAAVIALTPVSRGSVTLGTANPFDPPVIDLGLLDSAFDVFAMREAIKTSRRFISGPAWKGFVLDPIGAFANATTDDALDQFIRDGSFGSAHAVGTASMSPKGAKWGVVDPDLRVKGVTGLRIVDASVMPFVICGHTQAPTYIVAERGADLIKADW